ncbi:DUF3800 domain-containing protein [Aurantimonas coralicida]|uniref:DUF3800 domain-containing protein n=1 Tax=Aurantimonas coralicida TaxID=182270 RepID=UPI00238A8CB6|nr:DUF3800 domain-containing protein [Aurantimonas coralicida]MDE0924674.1 DUF3800 domain-containing protein [Aurantimonas coralicida]
MSELEDGRLISFDEAGFTGPQLLDEHQPHFIYASHDLSLAEAELLIGDLRKRYRFQGNELKAKRLKKRGDWDRIVADLTHATKGRAKVVMHDKKAALAGKFFEYFFEPVLADNSRLFYRIDFHRYIMTNIYVLMDDGTADFTDRATQMQDFMRSFDPAAANDIFASSGHGKIEMDRILRFCRGYAATISEGTVLLRPENSDTGKWTLDLTTTALFSLLFFIWGHVHPRLRLLCDDSKPLVAGAGIFNGWVGRDQSVAITDGKRDQMIRGNLVAPVAFGASETHPTIQVADLLAGLSMDTAIRGEKASSIARGWLQRHLFHEHSVVFLEEFTRPSDRRVKVGREVLKELARRADAGADPLDGMNEFVRRVELRLA